MCVLVFGLGKTIWKRVCYQLPSFAAFFSLSKMPPCVGLSRTRAAYNQCRTHSLKMSPLSSLDPFYLDEARGVKSHQNGAKFHHLHLPRPPRHRLFIRRHGPVLCQDVAGRTFTVKGREEGRERGWVGSCQYTNFNAPSLPPPLFRSHSKIWPSTGR